MKKIISFRHKETGEEFDIRYYIADREAGLVVLTMYKVKRPWLKWRRLPFRTELDSCYRASAFVAEYEDLDHLLNCFLAQAYPIAHEEWEKQQIIRKKLKEFFK